MRTIWKFPIPTRNQAGLANTAPLVWMFAGAKIIHVARQDPSDKDTLVTVWAEVDPDALTERRQLAVVGTGQAFPDFYRHLGTWLDDEFVWHLYDTTEVQP